MPLETPYHIPALLPETLDKLDVRRDGTYVDVTLGGAGHSLGILDRLGATGRLYSFDQDEEAIERAIALRREIPEPQRWTLVYSNFRYLTNFMRYYGVEGKVDGLLADLGVSFHHFDDPSRGFTFRGEAPLDMRMNRHGEVTAASLLEEITQERLAEILRLYGELDNAGRLARAIIEARRRAPLTTNARLVETVEPLLNPRQTKKELACIFQALRIEVNDELGALRRLLLSAVKTLKPGGRLAVITYHSLEDRLVKNFMRTGNLEGRVEQDFFGRRLTPLKLLTPRPITATAEEIANNPRSRSAKLRVAQTVIQPDHNG